MKFKTSYWGIKDIMSESELSELFCDLSFDDFTEEEKEEIFKYIHCQFRPRAIMYGVNAITGKPAIVVEWPNTHTFESEMLIVKWFITPFSCDDLDYLTSNTEKGEDICCDDLLELIDLAFCERDFEYLITETDDGGGYVNNRH